MRINYKEFCQVAITGRWCRAQQIKRDIDMGEQISILCSAMCMGDRNTSYTLAYLWICEPRSEVYKWSVYDLYTEIKEKINE